MKLDDRALARFLEGEGRLVPLGDGYAIGRAAYESARDVLVEECVRPDDHARALPRPPRASGDPRSSCSSASTRTGSRAASATRVCSRTER